MLKYIVILLDDTSVSYCHYTVTKTGRFLMPLETLRQGILFAMKENLNIQFVYPDYGLPQEYKDVINTIDHTRIKPFTPESENLSDADVVVINGVGSLKSLQAVDGKSCVLRVTKAEMFDNVRLIADAIGKMMRLNIVITDVETFGEDDFKRYKEALDSLAAVIERLYVDGSAPQLNILTDRMMLDKMNNCNAGWESVTLAPDGKFYVCPAFYLAGDDEDYGLGRAKFSIGDLQNGLDIKNPQLYRLDHAPLCRNCDAYQCKRCVWLNRKTTYEVNTPGHEQCVTAHLERNASRDLLMSIRKHGEFLPEKDIREITYLDPFDVREEW